MKVYVVLASDGRRYSIELFKTRESALKFINSAQSDLKNLDLIELRIQE